VVVFLGPHAWQTDKPPADLFEKPGTGAPRFFYLQYQRLTMFAMQDTSNGVADAGAPMGRGPGVDRPADSPPVSRQLPASDSTVIALAAQPSRDVIENLMVLLRGKTLIVRTPTEFSKAMKEIARQ
jgi:hypothetical protein